MLVDNGVDNDNRGNDYSHDATTGTVVAFVSDW